MINRKATQKLQQANVTKSAFTHLGLFEGIGGFSLDAHWSTKLVVVCDETKIDKQAVIEKVKSLSTADKIMTNAKGKNHV